MASGYVLGISAFYHDSAACLLHEDQILGAAQEERFTRVKGDERFPTRAAQYCLAAAGITTAELDAVVFYEKPLLKFERILETYVEIAPRGLTSFRRAGPLWTKDRLYAERQIRHGLGGYSGKIELLEEMRFPDSLGLLYSAFTYQAGFKVNSSEYKLMGLAPFGTPRYVDRIYSRLLKAHDDGSLSARWISPARFRSCAKPSSFVWPVTRTSGQDSRDCAWRRRVSESRRSWW